MARRLGAIIVAAALVTAQTAFADGAAPAPPAPLAPGPAAGVEAAQSGPDLNTVAIGAGIILAAAAVYLIVGEPRYHVHGQSHAASEKK